MSSSSKHTKAPRSEKMERERSRSPHQDEQLCCDAANNVAAELHRPTMTPVSLSGLDLSLVRISQGTKTGTELPHYSTLPRFAIELRDSWLEMPYGLDRGYMGQEPSFIVEGGTTNTCLTIVVRISPEQASLFSALDDKIRSLSREKGAWVSMVRGADEHIVKVKIALGPGVEHTQVSIVEKNNDANTPKKVTSGAGWDFVKAYAETYADFKGCQCKLVICPSKIWCVAGKRGATLKCLQLAIDTTRVSDSRRCVVTPAWTDADLLD